MEPLVLTSKNAIQRIVDAGIEAATEKIISRLVTTGGVKKAWLTNKEAMEYLGLSRPTLQRYRASGKLPYSKIGGNIFYRREDVDALLEKHMQGD